MMMRERKGESITTFSGLSFWPMSPYPEDIRTEDVVQGLSLKCRFNGQIRLFYSVAQHSVLCAIECIHRYPGKNHLARWALLHDIEEAYLPDITRPIKRSMNIGDLAEAAKLITLAGAARYGLRGSKMPRQVEEIDDSLLLAESRILQTTPILARALPKARAIHRDLIRHIENPWGFAEVQSRFYHLLHDLEIEGGPINGHRR